MGALGPRIFPPRARKKRNLYITSERDECLHVFSEEDPLLFLALIAVDCGYWIFTEVFKYVLMMQFSSCRNVEPPVHSDVMHSLWIHCPNWQLLNTVMDPITHITGLHSCTASMLYCEWVSQGYMCVICDWMPEEQTPSSSPVTHIWGCSVCWSCPKTMEHTIDRYQGENYSFSISHHTDPLVHFF